MAIQIRGGRSCVLGLLLFRVVELKRALWVRRVGNKEPSRHGMGLLGVVLVHVHVDVVAVRPVVLVGYVSGKVVFGNGF